MRPPPGGMDGMPPPPGGMSPPPVGPPGGSKIPPGGAAPGSEQGDACVVEVKADAEFQVRIVETP